jgi:predicted Fe-S protein YdhL (DUF1289 family)
MTIEQCPHAKSDMTPCVLKDGAICFAMDTHDEPICVGCERTPAAIGVDKPADWARTVARFYARKRPR